MEIFLILFWIILIVIILFAVYFNYYRKYSNAIKTKKYGNVSKDHTAIIIIEYPGHPFKKLFIYASGVDRLVKGLRELEESYVIYPCRSREEFLDVINKSETKKIWILGHGVRHGIRIGKEVIYYCECQNAPKKDCIVQLHCNHQGGKSLADYLCENKDNSYVSNDYRRVYDNVRDIDKIINNLKKKKLERKS
jgi:hypothetical protein